jgi:hypothetical protein
MEWKVRLQKVDRRDDRRMKRKMEKKRRRKKGENRPSYTTVDSLSRTAGDGPALTRAVYPAHFADQECGNCPFRWRVPALER